MEEYVIDSIRKILININFPSVFSIHNKSEHVYNNGMNINRSEITRLQTLSKDTNQKSEVFQYGIKINGTKYVVIEILEDTLGLVFVHAKSHEESTISLIGRCYTLTIQYDNELVPMYHSVKIEKLKNQFDTFNKLLA